MGWSVGWDTEHERWRGYGVPAYCDAEPCRARIDRGMGYAADPNREDTLPVLFTCGEHSVDDVDVDNLPPEHPEWVRHLLTDPSWAYWRKENPEQVARLEAAA